jgi:hypothetical protein
VYTAQQAARLPAPLPLAYRYVTSNQITGEPFSNTYLTPSVARRAGSSAAFSLALSLTLSLALLLVLSLLLALSLPLQLPLPN